MTILDKKLDRRNTVDSHDFKVGGEGGTPTTVSECVGQKNPRTEAVRH